MGHRRVAFASPGARAAVVVGHGAAPAADAVDALFPDLRISPEGAPDLLLTLSGGPDGWEIRSEDGRGWRAEGMAGILTRLELTLAEALVAGHPGIGLHAGGVVGPSGGAVLLGGPGGSGKSSLTAALALAGAPVLGDDVVLLHEGVVHPFRRLLKLEEPAREILGVPRPEGPLARVWPEVTFLHPRALGSRWADPAPVDAVVLPHRAPGSEPVLEERRASEVLPDLLAQLVLVPRVERTAFETLADALADARCFRLHYWETPAAAEVLSATLARGG